MIEYPIGASGQVIALTNDVLTARVFKMFDTDGAVKDAAKRGVVGMIGRWLR